MSHIESAGELYVANAIVSGNDKISVITENSWTVFL